ncbi:hypothetical protein A3844_02625 [Paenibacillus helianthi]|uniref:Ethanolamine utilization protein n=1 Tax=Paenibacillus helianthi TaxID=1349432 RepID=A0ABX3EZ55_9BACL|nr:ethanolamine ammonia-lyase reactivating factor EutA [Paenibacillus helianthi]OKP92025.1 hypothetical protein A3844_02625 [Paenibacillus helianthi]
MQNEEWLTSAGIDIGTSTTKCVFSRLKIERQSGLSSLPQFHITERNVFYESRMHRTPLIGDSQIDLGQLERILASEYSNAGLLPDDIHTGAVIITGETAFKQQADVVLHSLAASAGEFVVAQAGGDLEAVLAGRGSGAEARSLHVKGQVVNVDIGGGTANAAFFEGGSCIRTLNFHIGGRLIMLERDGSITRISPSVLQWLKAAGFKMLQEGEVAEIGRLRQLAERWSEMLLEGIQETVDWSKYPLIYGNPDSRKVRAETEIAEIWISGGVGALMEQESPPNLAEAARFGDIGPLLASALRIAGIRYPVKLQAAPEAQRATVIGAGVHTAMLSGSTVFADRMLLPLRNLPLVRVTWHDQLGEELTAIELGVKEAFAEGKQKYGGAGTEACKFAVIVPHLSVCTYPMIRRIAEAAAASALHYQLEMAVIICENDIAKALGNCIHLITGGNLPCVCLDQVAARHGDYVDIGEPVGEGYIPLAVKTLVFHS